jgi:peroxin-6
MDRVVSQLLTEIDGLDKFNSNNQTEKPTQIFLIGATNRPDLIDASLLRPGRFDKLIYVPIPKSFDERLKIFKALIRK